MEESIQFAKKYLEDLLTFFGLNTDVRATNSEDEVIELHVPSTHLNGFLIGHKGETVHAMQFLVSNALKNAGHEITRVNIDVAEYKQQRANRLAKKAEEWIAEVKDKGEHKHLRPMNAADRRTIHKTASEHGLVTESEGEGRDRHIVIKPTDETAKDTEEDAMPEPESAPEDAPGQDSEETVKNEAKEEAESGGSDDLPDSQSEKDESDSQSGEY